MQSHHRGFTLVEMIVAVGLFAVVMTICVTSLLSLVSANRKAQGLQSVMNNLNVALDGMVRSIRMGTNYHCGNGTYTQTRDCQNGDTLIAFEPVGSIYNSDTGSWSDSAWLYWFARDENGVGRLYKSETGSQTGGVPVTAPDVSIDSATFYVVGSSDSDDLQPKTLIVVKGTAGGVSKEKSTFHIQATAVQRVLDI